MSFQARATWLVLAVLVLLGAVMVAVLPLGSAEVRAVAAQFQPPPDAVPYQGRVTSRRIVCLGASPCPSLFRSWTFSRRLDVSDLDAQLAAAGWPFEVEGDCRPEPRTYAQVALCTADGEVDGYTVTVTQHGGSRTETTVLTLDVRPTG